MSKTFLNLVIPAPDSGQSPPPCTSIGDPELFFPPSYTEGHEHQIEEAKAVCRSCPLKFACLEFALETGDKHAILGGTTPPEREVMRLRRIARGELRAGRRPQQKWNVEAA